MIELSILLNEHKLLNFLVCFLVFCVLNPFSYDHAPNIVKTINTDKSSLPTHQFIFNDQTCQIYYRRNTF